MNEKKDNNKLKEIFFIIIYALLATIVLAFILLIINCVWPKQNLFNPETWGTISDWFTYLVTLIGGVFIYITLDSQMKVQKDQTRIFKMEELKYIREIRPEIKFDFTLPLRLNRKKNTVDIVEVDLFVFSDRACNYSLKAYTENKVLEEPKIRKMVRIGNSTFYKNFSLELNVLGYTDGIATIESLTLNLKYSDCDGNEYLYNYGVQFFHKGKDNIEFTVILNDDKLVKQVY